MDNLRIAMTIVSVMAGVLGSLVGGSATVATAWITRRRSLRRELMSGDMRQREKLYGDFIAAMREASRRRLHPHARRSRRNCSHSMRLSNRIRLTASPPVLAEAEHLLSRIADQYFSRNLTAARRCANSPTRQAPIR